jgi:hypothetical protein
MVCLNLRAVWVHFRWLAVLTVSLFPLVSVGVIASFWIPATMVDRLLREASIPFLIVIECAYAVALVLAVIGAIVFVILYFRGRRRGTSRPAVARGLLLSVSLLFALGVAEAASACWRSWSHRNIAMPVGGLARGEGAKPRRFAPPLQPELATEFPDPRGDRTIDVVVLGESSAEGVPFQKWLSIGKIVAWQLERVFAGRPVRLSVLARSGDTLEKQHHALASLSRRPDLLIVYCGHNEFASRLWWSRDPDYYLVDSKPRDWTVLLDRIRELSSICGLIQEAAARCKLGLPPAPAVKRDLIDVPVYRPDEYAVILADFRRRLELMVTYAECVGAISVLVMPPGNEAGYDPNRSFLASTTTPLQRAAFARDFLAARHWEAGDLTASIRRYRALLVRQPGFAETHFRLAQLLERTGAWDEAYEHYAAARDLDGYPTRCLTPFQEAYREVAARHGCILVDGQSYFHAIGHHGLLDDDLFQDAMHPSLRGHIALGQAVLHELQARRCFGWPDNAPAPIIDPASCADHFGLKKQDWAGVSQWASGFYQLVTPLRYESSYRSRKRLAYLSSQQIIAAGGAPESVGVPNLGIPPPVPLVGGRIGDLIGNTSD